MRWREKALSADRVSTKVWANAFARLWWGAEFTRVDRPAEVLRLFSLEERLDPYAFTALLVEDAQLEAALLQRVLAQSRTVAVSFIGLVKSLGRSAMPSERAFDLARRLHLAGSTTVLDAFDADRAPERPYAVSVDGARACREFLLELLRDEPASRIDGPAATPPDPTADAEPTAPRKSGLRGWLGGFFRDDKPRT